MHIAKIFVCLIAWCFMGFSGSASAQTLAVGDSTGLTPISQQKTRVAIPGNLYAALERNTPSGVIIETVDALLKQKGINPVYLSMPSSDALKEAAKGVIKLATVLVPVDKFRNDVYFSDPVVTEYNVIMALRDKNFTLSRWSDLNGKRIGAHQGYSYPLLEKRPHLNVTRYPTDGEMIRSLLLGQEDAVVIAGVSDIYAFRSEGIQSKVDILRMAIGAVPLTVAFSKKHYTEADVQEFNTSLRAFKKTEKWQSILDRNGISDLVHDWPILTAE